MILGQYMAGSLILTPNGPPFFSSWRNVPGAYSEFFENFLKPRIPWKSGFFQQNNGRKRMKEVTNPKYHVGLSFLMETFGIDEKQFWFCENSWNIRMS